MDHFESTGVRVPATLPGRQPAPDETADTRAALDALFDAQFASVFNFVVARSGSPTIAEDVAAETFVEAVRVAKQGRLAEVTPPWLFMVARRRLIDHWRADERYRRRVERLRMRRVDADVSEVIEDERVLDALDSLPTRQRAALTLRYLDGYSVSEIADALEVTYRAAESLLSRARTNFGKSYGDQ